MYSQPFVPISADHEARGVPEEKRQPRGWQIRSFRLEYDLDLEGVSAPRACVCDDSTGEAG